MKSPWKKISSTQKYKNPWIRVREDKVIRPDGTNGIYGVVDLTGSSAVVALTENNKVFLIRQWRYPLSCYTVEMPWGGRKRSETYLQCAKRELREETGVTAKQWNSIGKVADCPGVVNEFAHLYVARRLTIGSPIVLPEESDQEVVCIPFKRALAWMYSNKINDAVSIACLVRAKEYLKL